jgi:hypothetical protein
VFGGWYGFYWIIDAYVFRRYVNQLAFLGHLEINSMKYTQTLYRNRGLKRRIRIKRRSFGCTDRFLLVVRPKDKNYY